MEKLMSDRDPVGRRSFLGFLGLAGLSLAGGGRRGVSDLLPFLKGPDDPEVPNEIVQKIMSERFGSREIKRGHVTLDMPPLAEDGRVVPVAIESDLPMTPDSYVKAVYLIVDHNPDPLVTVFHLTPAFERVKIETRIKMKRTCWIRAIVETNNDELWADYMKVETTLNGCG
jgi:sulfur-oxidizing protein SoxY